MTKWFVIETHADNNEGTFGPFETLGGAAAFVKDACVFPLSSDRLSKITIQKKATND